MSEFLEMLPFDKKERVPTAEKVIRDGQNMYNNARFVIVLNESGEIIKTIDREHNFIGDIFVILAPVTYKDIYIPMSVILEIGIGRAIPYNGFEQHFKNERTRVIKRIPVAKFKDENLLKFMPTIAKILEAIVVARVANWKNEDFFIFSAGRSKRRGIFFTVSNKDKIICFANYLKDITSRDYLRTSRASGLSRWTRGFCNKQYSPKQLKSFVRPKKIWDMLSNGNYPEHYLDYILNQLTNNQKEVVVDVLRAFSVREMRNKKGDDEEILRVSQLSIQEILKTPEAPIEFKELKSIYSDKEKEIIKSWPIHIVCHPNKDNRRGETGLGSAHATKCLRVELVPNKELVKLFKEKQHKTEDISLTDGEIIPHDSDIPF